MTREYYLDVRVEVVAQLAEAVLDPAEQAVERGEVLQARPVHQRLEPLAEDAGEVFAEQLPLHCVD